MDYVDIGFDSFLQKKKITSDDIPLSLINPNDNVMNAFGRVINTASQLRFSNYNLEGQIESLPANALKSGLIQGNQISIDLDNGIIISRDKFNKRVVINQGIMKVSKKGYDADTALPENLIFNGDQ